MRYASILRWTSALVLIGLSVVSIAYSQDPSVTAICSTAGTVSSSQSIHFGGRFIASTGTLRVLVVFVRFADDNETSSTWPDPTVLPSWASNFVDPSYSSNGIYTPNRASEWFYENSYGNFHVIGEYALIVPEGALTIGLKVRIFQACSISAEYSFARTNGTSVGGSFSPVENSILWDIPAFRQNFFQDEKFDRHGSSLSLSLTFQLAS